MEEIHVFTTIPQPYGFESHVRHEEMYCYANSKTAPPCQMKILDYDKWCIQSCVNMAMLLSFEDVFLMNSKLWS